MKLIKKYLNAGTITTAEPFYKSYMKRLSKATLGVLPGTGIVMDYLQDNPGGVFTGIFGDTGLVMELVPDSPSKKVVTGHSYRRYKRGKGWQEPNRAIHHVNEISRVGTRNLGRVLGKVGMYLDLPYMADDIIEIKNALFNLPPEQESLGDNIYSTLLGLQDIKGNKK